MSPSAIRDASARRVLNEFRFGWMTVDGGQMSLNRGVDFAGQVGLHGVTQRSARHGLSAGLDRRAVQHDRRSHVVRHPRQPALRAVRQLHASTAAAHRIKFGGYYFHLQLRPEQPDNARGAFTYTGQFTGNAFADFLLGYPTSATSGIGRGDEDGRTNWLHLYAQDDWRSRDNLTVNVGPALRVSTSTCTTSNNRLSSIDLSVPGGRFVIASDEQRRHRSRRARRCCR